MRSRTGCLTCRQRKLKCDEKKPICGQCCKASRECIPSSGIVFRHQHNASMNGDDSSDENTLKGFYSYKNTFDNNTIWIDIPKQVTFINTTNPYLDLPDIPDMDNMSTTSMDSPRSYEPRLNMNWPTPDSNFLASSKPTTPVSNYMSPDRLDHPIPYGSLDFEMVNPLDNMSLLYTPPSSSDSTPASPSLSLFQHRMQQVFRDPARVTPPIDPQLSSPIEPASDSLSRSTSAPRSVSSCPSVEPVAEHDREIAYLLRWFAEGPGTWMDIFDLGTYFASYVPVKARESPLLKYAAVAYAAKSLARIHSRKPTNPGTMTFPVTLEQTPEASSVDWYHKATQYYDTAVTLLLQALKDESTPTWLESDHSLANVSLDAYAPQGSIPKRRRTSSNVSCRSSRDELLAASAILCTFESLDASMSEWAKHLNGAKSLLVSAQGDQMPIQLPTPRSPTSSGSFSFVSKARKATFWNIARQDMLAAFISKTHTRLDTEDYSLWRDAGLLVNEHGFIDIAKSTLSDTEDMKEDIVCNSLVWLMAKLVNFMALEDDLADEFVTAWPAFPQRTQLDVWRHLKKQFQIWYDSLPITFRPSARVDARTPSQSLQVGGSAIFTEVWYSIPMCASTMQNYHMSQILLNMNKRHESTQGRTTVFARLNSYQSVLAACQIHSREIIGISLARPDDAVRINSTQPLYTAGQCLSDARERQVLVDLLRDIETDIGWATGYRVKQLLGQWQYQEHEEMHMG